MRNYRNVIKQNNILSLTKGETQTSDSEIILIQTKTKFNFTVGTKVFKSSINGYVIFIGSYRNNESFLLNDFTILFSESMNDDTGLTQYTILAYKKIVKDEIINFTSLERFGGTFYETEHDITSFNVHISRGADYPLYPAIVFPVPHYNKTTFGIISQIVNHFKIFTASPNEYSVSSDMDNDYRIITYVAHSLIKSANQQTLDFRYNRGITGDHPNLKLIQFIFYKEGW